MLLGLVLAVGPELSVERRPVDHDAEPPEMVRWHPVLSAHPDVVLAGISDGDDSRGVSDGPARAVGQQVRRAHLQLELRAQGPAAEVVECFGLDQNSRVGQYLHGGRMLVLL